MEHVGSAHDDAELEVLKAVARQRIAAGQGELDLGVDAVPESAGPLPITASRMAQLWDALSCVYDALGFDVAAGEDEVFRGLVLARIIEPTSKFDSLRVLDEVGVASPSYATTKRRLPAYATDAWRERLAALCAAHTRLGPTSLVLYEVSTLYFETDTGDGFREPGFSKERRLEPQITKTVNRELEEKARTLAGWKSYVTNLPDTTAEFVISSYRRLFNIEKSFRMSTHDLQARPIYHRKRDSIEAHLTVVFAALAISHWIENTTGWSVKKFVKTARRYRTIHIKTGEHTLTAADPLPDDLRAALNAIHARAMGH